MKNEDLIKLSKEEILRSHKQLYIERFRAVFGYKPACASCTFSTDFKKFKNKINGVEPIKPYLTMEKTDKKEYKLKPMYNSTILSFTDKGRINRAYGREITDEFAKAFLTKGSKEVLKKRAEMFSVIPSAEKKTTAPEEGENIKPEKKTRKKKK